MRSIFIIGLAFAVCFCIPQKSTAQLKDTTIYKVLDSKYLTRATVFAGIGVDEVRFRESEKLNSLILEKSIPELQLSVRKGLFSYEDLTIFYLNRIYKYDRENKLSLNAVISLNPNAIAQARAMDRARVTEKRLPQSANRLEGMPILLKDNINSSEMPTTAGAAAMLENQTSDADLVRRLKDSGAIILGKANLSEWAYFFCGECPSGYSAAGGQTLNPYGRKIMDTGGSSSGSGVAVAANFAVAAIGSETSGSILSPSSQNSVVGLKPTTGSISGSGVIPISSYLDTAGPITKSVIDNAILMQAMSVNPSDYVLAAQTGGNLLNARLGYFQSYTAIPLYAAAIKDLEAQGAKMVVMQPARPKLDGFVTLLNVDMIQDLPAYFNDNAMTSFKGWDVNRVMQWNKQDSVRSMPYGQKLFQGILDEKMTGTTDIAALKSRLTAAAQEHLSGLLKTYDVQGFVSINNYNAGEAAVAFYPGLTVPMGYNANKEPMGLTFFAPSGEELKLYAWAAAYEQATKKRVIPAKYTN
jgi:amidase